MRRVVSLDKDANLLHQTLDEQMEIKTRTNPLITPFGSVFHS